jgi:glycine C-acetyltransferase/8-amino-7-oxononanoate synthase
MSDIEERLAEIRSAGLYRRMRMVAGPQGPRILLDGRPVLLLCSNNYLGLADHPRVREAAAEAAIRYGAGSGASRLVSGNMTIHRRLEEQLAEFEGSQACLLFGSGYLANTGVIAALAREGDVVLSDRLNHASIVDGCRLARAETFVYDHADVEQLEWGLRQAGTACSRWTATRRHSPRSSSSRSASTRGCWSTRPTERAASGRAAVARWPRRAWKARWT